MRGLKKVRILDLKLIEGNLFDMIDYVYSYLLSNIRASSKIIGTRRELTYEYPVEAIARL